MSTPLTTPSGDISVELATILIRVRVRVRVGVGATVRAVPCSHPSVDMEVEVKFDGEAAAVVEEVLRSHAVQGEAHTCE